MYFLYMYVRHISPHIWKEKLSKQHDVCFFFFFVQLVKIKKYIYIWENGSMALGLKAT